ncbi:MAG TPA: hypothetical protein VGK23_07325 [Methanomassiliicoccales archaeon]|jgi:DNA-binding PadR family transcriptional regulator
MNTLTVQERILIHLDANRGKRNDYSAPFEITQDGVGQALIITRAHASIELKTLLADGMVDEGLHHVAGYPQMRKTYEITAKGSQRVSNVKDFAKVSGMALIVASPAKNAHRENDIKLLKQDIRTAKDRLNNLEVRLMALEV